jgi:hypothetical protein
VDVPTLAVDPQAAAYNERLCAERGLAFDPVAWVCK